MSLCNVNQAVKRLNYFGDHSSLHGVRYMLTDRPNAPCGQRLVWLSIVTCSLLGMFYILNQGTTLFEDEVISFVTETTYLRWNTDFPAVTICEAVDNDKLTDYYEDNGIPIELTTFYKEIVYLDGQHYCRSCADCDKNRCPRNLAEIVAGFRSKCDDTLARCSWRGQNFNCCDRFKPIDTEYGECFVFNSALINKTRPHLSNKLTGPGYLEFAVMETVKIDVHSPDDIMFRNFDKPIVNGKDGDLPFGSKFELRFKVEETTNEEQVRQLPPATRKCLFSDERRDAREDAAAYSSYSYSTCIMRCRARKQLQTCNCTHYMLPRTAENEPICNIEGLVCLTEFAESTDLDDIDLECDCMPSCEEPNYQTILIKNTPNTGALTEELIARGTLISIYMECLPTTRVKRLVVRSSLDYVVFVGGTAGIFFGASILSIIEIVYLVFIRKYNK